MKFRNKATLEIRKAEMREDGIYLWDGISGQWWKYDLETLAKCWDYYIEPKEPLIKDEKTRKAVKAWAEANEINSSHYYDTSVEFDRAEHRLLWIETSIEFNEPECLGSLEDGVKYTIDELCGKEEE